MTKNIYKKSDNENSETGKKVLTDGLDHTN